MSYILVLGAGQLARMMALAGAPLGIKIRAYDVREHACIHPLTGENYAQTLEEAIEDAEKITAEFEHIPKDILALCEKTGRLYPNSHSISAGGDRRLEKALLEKVQVNNAPYHIIQSQADLSRAATNLGLPLILKSARDGYDGKGQWRLHAEKDIAPLWQQLRYFLADEKGNKEQAILAEAYIPFTKEVSLIGTRHKNGDIYCYPLTENIHKDGILRISLSLTQAPHLQKQAEAVFRRIANELDYVGVLAIEFFNLEDRLLVNEIAPRVHNSGHWTQNGATICQFEHHLRAITERPLGQTAQTHVSAMINIIGHAKVPDAVLEYGHCHWYDKAPREGRKIGHINVCAASISALVDRLEKLQCLLFEDEFPCIQEAITSLQKQG